MKKIDKRKKADKGLEQQILDKNDEFIKEQNDIRNNENKININKELKYLKEKIKGHDNEFKIIKENKKDININNKDELKDYKERIKYKNNFDIIIIIIISFLILMGCIFQYNTNDKVNNINEEIKEINNKVNKINGETKKTSDKVNNINEEIKEINNKLNKINGETKKTNEKVNNINEEIKKTDNKVNNINIFLEFRDFDNYYLSKSLINQGIMKYFNKKIKKYYPLYLASRDGYEQEYFHEKCDGKKFTVTLVLTEKNKIFGGFTELEWNKSSGIRLGKKGFIFSINNNKIYYSRNIYEIYNLEYRGPSFGYGFSIYSKNGYDFTNEEFSFFNVPGGLYALAGEEEFLVKNYVVYQIELE